MTKICFLFSLTLILSSCNKRDAELRALIAGNEAMENVILNLDNDHERMWRSIGHIYRDRGERPQEKMILDKADSLRSGSRNLFKTITLMKENLIASDSGNYNKSVSFDEGQSKGLEKNIAAWYNEQMPTLKNPEDSLHISLKRLREKMPLSLHLINLSNLQWKILKLETPILEKLITEIDPDPVGRFEVVKVNVSAYANVVEEGQEYIADVNLVLISNSKTFVKEVKVNGQIFPTDSNGIGRVSFAVKGDKFNKEGLCKKTWNGSITLHGPLRDTSFVISKEYLVKKRCVK